MYRKIPPLSNSQIQIVLGISNAPCRLTFVCFDRTQILEVQHVNGIPLVGTIGRLSHKTFHMSSPTFSTFCLLDFQMILLLKCINAFVHV